MLGLRDELARAFALRHVLTLAELLPEPLAQRLRPVLGKPLDRSQTLRAHLAKLSHDAPDRLLDLLPP